MFRPVHCLWGCSDATSPVKRRVGDVETTRKVRKSLRKVRWISSDRDVTPSVDPAPNRRNYVENTVPYYRQASV